MELGIILRHDPLTLGSGCVENTEVRGAFVQSSRTTVKGAGKNGLKVRCSRHAADMPQRWGSVGKTLSLLHEIRKLVRVTLFFFSVFYISNESPDLRVHFAKRISPNGAELPKLCLHQVSEAVMSLPNAEINQQQWIVMGKPIILVGVNLTYL